MVRSVVLDVAVKSSISREGIRINILGFNLLPIKERAFPVNENYIFSLRP